VQTTAANKLGQQAQRPGTATSQNKNQAQDKKATPKPTAEAIKEKPVTGKTSKRPESPKPKPMKSSSSSKQVEAEKEKDKKERQSEQEMKNSKLLSKLMTDMELMQSKLSQMEQENKSLKTKAEMQSKDRSKEVQINPQNHQQESDLSIKNEIADIKKLLEKSILIQNDKPHFSQERQHTEDSRSQHHTEVASKMNHTFAQEPNMQGYGLASAVMNEYELKWMNILGKEGDKLNLTKLGLQNDRLTLERRKLSIKTHEFEMRKELEDMRLERGHSLSNKIKENLLHQQQVFRDEYASLKERSARYLMKQKNLNVLEKSYLFARKNGGLNEAANQHLDELYIIYMESGEDEAGHPLDRELGPNDEGLSFDSHPTSNLEMDNMRDDNDSHSKSEFKMSSFKESNHRIQHLNHQPRHLPTEPSDYNYSLEDIRRTIGSGYKPSYEQDDLSRDSLKRYFTNQDRFYDTMKQQVRSSNQVVSMMGRYSGYTPGRSTVSPYY
jgi:hypothetical protein